MNIQEIFYILGIIYMSVTLVIYIVILVAIFAVKKKVDNITHMVEEKINIVQRLTSDPARTAMTVGSAVAGKALKKASTVLRKS